jgi:hypothetical protein
MSWELWATAGLAAVAWFWWDGLRKREIAIATARIACQRAGVQLLDETVALARTRLRRDENQRARLYREFAFEFSDTGDNRQSGRIYLLGNRLLDVNLILAARPEPSPAPDNVIDFPRR